LQQFLDRADRVDVLAFTLKPPNPGYRGRKQVENLVADTNAAMARVVLTAPKDDLEGLKVDADFVRQARTHAERYGNIRATAEFEEEGELHPEKWRSEVEGGPHTEAAPVDSSGDVSLDALRESLEAPSSGNVIPEAEDE
jgi:hypothetical protein